MTFDGSDPWPEYEAHLEEYAKYYQWTDQQKAMNLSVSLRGNARSILLDLPAEDRQDYRTLAGALKQHFCPAEKIFVYQAELQNRRLQPEEELPDFAREIRRKTRLAFPTADPATLETLMKTHFCNGLTNRDMRLTVLKSHPCTITQALAYATEYDSIMRTDGGQYDRRSKGRQLKTDETEPAVPDPLQQAAALQKQVEDSTKQLSEMMREVQRLLDSRPPPRPRRPKTELQCFNCGEKGHFARECPRARQPASSNPQQIPPQNQEN